MTSPTSKLRSLIRKLLSEIAEEDKVNEMNTTGNIEGYQTPHAFSGSDEDTHKKNMKKN